jgi:GT2 family glycosyltransferase
MLNSICTVIINFQTPDLLSVAVESFRNHYPQVELLLVDNGSKDNSPDLIHEFEQSNPHKVKTLFLTKNIYHGPAMHKAIGLVDKEYVFFLDSDTETKRGGFLEEMCSTLEVSKEIYGIGRELKVNRRGFLSENGEVILTPAYLLLRKNIYSALPPFEHHGQPVMKNFIAARQKGWILKSYPIEDYIEHRWRGTASRFGYGLGLKGKIDFILNKIGF